MVTELKDNRTGITAYFGVQRTQLTPRAWMTRWHIEIKIEFYNCNKLQSTATKNHGSFLYKLNCSICDYG